MILHSPHFDVPAIKTMLNVSSEGGTASC